MKKMLTNFKQIVISLFVIQVLMPQLMAQTTSTMPVYIVTDIDGNKYDTVKIGNQIWLKQNLKVTHYRNGNAIPNITDDNLWRQLKTGAYCNEDNDTNNGNIYGRLYNWYTVADSRKMCPTGWHVTTDSEWTTLTIFLGGESIAGSKLKEAGIAHWPSPNTAATNETGFTALPGSERMAEEGVTFNTFAGWWSSTEENATNAWSPHINFFYDNVTRAIYDKKIGFSVRCLKD